LGRILDFSWEEIYESFGRKLLKRVKQKIYHIEQKSYDRIYTFNASRPLFKSSEV